MNFHNFTVTSKFVLKLFLILVATYGIFNLKHLKNVAM